MVHIDIYGKRLQTGGEYEWTLLLHWFATLKETKLAYEAADEMYNAKRPNIIRAEIKCTVYSRTIDKDQGSQLMQVSRSGLLHLSNCSSGL